MRKSRLFLIFSHSLTQEQIKDAKDSLDVEEFISLPPHLQKLFSNIPPELNEIDEYLQPIKEYIKDKTKKGDYILIQGDFGATYTMVKFAFKLHLIPIYATTKRVSFEDIDNGKVIKESEFKHIKFRKY